MSEELEEGWVVRGLEIWKVAPDLDSIHVATFTSKAIADWVVGFAPYFHPVFRLADAASEVERYMAGRFTIPRSVRKEFVEAVNAVQVMRYPDWPDDGSQNE